MDRSWEDTMGPYGIGKLETAAPFSRRYEHAAFGGLRLDCAGLVKP